MEPPPDLLAQHVAEDVLRHDAALEVDAEPLTCNRGTAHHVRSRAVLLACELEQLELGRHRSARPCPILPLPPCVGAVRRREADDLRHVGDREALSDRLAEILADVFEFWTGHRNSNSFLAARSISGGIL